MLNRSALIAAICLAAGAAAAAEVEAPRTVTVAAGARYQAGWLRRLLLGRPLAGGLGHARRSSRPGAGPALTPGPAHRHVARVLPIPGGRRRRTRDESRRGLPDSTASQRRNRGVHLCARGEHRIGGLLSG